MRFKCFLPALTGALAALVVFCGHAESQSFTLAPMPMQRFTDNNGNPCSGCKLFTYVAGTTTKLAAYTDSTGATPQTNPVVMNTRGEAPVWLGGGVAYKFVLSPSTDSDPPSNAFWTVDNIIGNSALPVIAWQSFGAKCDGTTDDSGALSKIFSAFPNGSIIQVPATGHSCVIKPGITTSVNNTAIRGVPLNHWPGFSATDPEVYAASGSAIKCTDTTNSCITFTGVGNTVRDVNFVYNQTALVNSGSWTPTIYPYTLTFAPGNFSGIENVSFNGATHCVDWEGPSGGTAGIGSFMHTVDFNGCFVRGTKFHRIDNTMECSNLRYDNYWAQGNAAVTTYIEANKIDWDMQYVANLQCSNVEFFQSFKSIQCTNDSVTNGFGTLTFACAHLQLANLSHNEVCQAFFPATAAAITSGRMTNVIAFGDTGTNCAKGTTAMFDWSSSQANWTIAGLDGGFMQSVAAIGALSNIYIFAPDVQQYSAFAIGANAFRLSSGGVLSITGPYQVIRPGAGAGAMVGAGLDGTSGRIQGIQGGAGGNGVNGEGYTLIEGSGDTVSAGDIAFFDPTGARQGYMGRTDTFHTVNVVSDHGAVSISGCPSGGCPGGGPSSPAYAGGVYLNGAGGSQISVSTVNTNQTQLNIIGLPTSCTGLATGSLWNSSGTVHVC